MNRKKLNRLYWTVALFILIGGFVSILWGQVSLGYNLFYTIWTSIIAMLLVGYISVKIIQKELSSQTVKEEQRCTTRNKA